MTFDISKLVFLDTESRAGADAADLKQVGTYKYANSATAIVLTYAIGMGKVQCIHSIDGLGWDDLPAGLQAAFKDPLTTFVAWHASFDRAIWNYAMFGTPVMLPHRTVDCMAQAMASNLPASLGMAAERLSKLTRANTAQKDSAGKSLIKLWTVPDGPRPEQFPQAWQEFLDYACDDIRSMRDIWLSTNPLPLDEWRTYWGNETLCERGIAVDVPYCEKAAALADEALIRTNARLKQITNGAIRTVNQHVVIARWVYDRLPDQEARDIMISALIEEDEEQDVEDDEGITWTEKISIERANVERLLVYLRSIEHDDAVLLEVLELREFGAGSSFKKFRAILNQQVGGRIRGQITFNGAPQTGRFSGKGVQVQNTTRSTLGIDDSDDYGTYEEPTVAAIEKGCTLDQLAAMEPVKVVPLRKLALLVRPAIIAPPRRTLVKADYAQVEARVEPWLAGSDDAERRLDAFRAVDRDPDAPDVYKVTASGMWSIPVEDVSKEQRGGGKITDLACQFGGGKGALMSMGIKYKLYFSEERAQQLVDLWRIANPWAPAYWGKHNQHESYGMWGAAMRAYENPGTVQQAGRINLIYDHSYLGGSMFMILPSQRILTYPSCKVREYERKEKKTGRVIEIRKGLTFLRPDGYRSMYGGLLVENATQATAADLLRLSIAEIEEERLCELVLHSHDELVAEVDDNPEAIALAESVIREVMLAERDWNEGLPLGVDVTPRWYYSSAKLRKDPSNAPV